MILKVNSDYLKDGLLGCTLCSLIEDSHLCTHYHENLKSNLVIISFNSINQLIFVIEKSCFICGMNWIIKLI